SQGLADLIVNFEAFLTVFNSGLSQPCAGEYESNMTCWQLYLLPGLESRGLYSPGEAPNEDELGDPGRGSINRAAPSRAEVTKDMTRLAGSPPPRDLEELLYGVVSGSTGTGG
ncbi:MAG: hypothetical protein ACRDKZ_05750, partial [Actinomycetota bacterium]